MSSIENTTIAESSSQYLRRNSDTTIESPMEPIPRIPKLVRQNALRGEELKRVMFRKPALKSGKEE